MPEAGRHVFLTHRIAYLIEKGINPYNILAITVSTASVSLNSETTTTFNEYANIAGSFTNTSGSNSTVSPSSYNSIAAYSAQTVTVTGVSQCSSTITVSFTPTDTVNYNTVTSTINVTIKASCAWVKHWKSNGNTYSQCTAGTQPSDPKPGDTYITCESYHGGKSKWKVKTFPCNDGEKK